MRALSTVIYYQGNQTDKQGHPYLMHLIRVAGRGRNKLEMTVGLLHDVVEDTPLQLNYIRLRFGDEVADAVDHLTRREGEEYGDFIERCAQNETAEFVKLHDIIDHLRGEDAANLSDSLRGRYRRGYYRLTGRHWDKVKHLSDG
jgi:(p)ppGpp synthase/HD superfamily hydrolase